MALKKRFDPVYEAAESPSDVDSRLSVGRSSTGGSGLPSPLTFLAEPVINMRLFSDVLNMSSPSMTLASSPSITSTPPSVASSIGGVPTFAVPLGKASVSPVVFTNLLPEDNTFTQIAMGPRPVGLFPPISPIGMPLLPSPSLSPTLAVTNLQTRTMILMEPAMPLDHLHRVVLPQPQSLVMPRTSPSPPFLVFSPGTSPLTRPACFGSFGDSSEVKDLDNKYKCESCNFLTDSKSQLDHHAQLHRLQRPIPSPPPIALHRPTPSPPPTTLPRHSPPSKLLAHELKQQQPGSAMRPVVARDPDKEEPKALEAELISPNVVKKLIRCQSCDKIVNESSLESHNATFHGSIRKSKGDAAEDEGDSRIVCHFCLKSYSSDVSLTAHIRRKHENNNVTCNVCGKVCSTVPDLRSHQRVHEPNLERRFACDMCDYKAVRKPDLTRHRLRHQGHDTFKCDWCDATYLGRKSLVEHEAESHPEHRKSFLCGECSYSTNTKADFELHVRLKHKAGPTFDVKKA